ncbi:MAG: DUF3623 family protein [Gemmatimonadales bacterium]|nr:MAG: DUF3623 family protein [Gemmatimonadales bacterium]
MSGLLGGVPLDRVAAVAVALVAWWGGTGLLLLLARAATRGAQREILLVGASGAAVAAGAGAVAIRDTGGISGALMGFGIGVLLWAWHELAFLSGVVTGPVRTPLPDKVSGFRRFRHAVGTILHHEVALAATVLVLGVISLGAVNAVAFQTFFLLWIMRLLAKLNLFVGVPNPNRHLFPPRLAHLASLVPPRPAGVFHTLSLAAIGVGAAALGVAGWTAPGTFEGVSLLLLATLAGLAWVEHLVMRLPVRFETLWGWEGDAELLAADVQTARKLNSRR